MEWRDVLVKKGFEIHVVGTPLLLESTKKPIVNVLMPNQRVGELAVSEDQAALAVLEQGDWKASKEKWEKLAADKGFGYQTFDVRYENQSATMWLFQKKRREDPEFRELNLDVTKMILEGESIRFAELNRRMRDMARDPTFQRRDLEIKLSTPRAALEAFDNAGLFKTVAGAPEYVLDQGWYDEFNVVDAGERQWMIWNNEDGTDPWEIREPGGQTRVFERAADVDSWLSRALRGKYAVGVKESGLAVFDLDTLAMIAETRMVGGTVHNVQGNVVVVTHNNKPLDIDPFAYRDADGSYKPNVNVWPVVFGGPVDDVWTTPTLACAVTAQTLVLVDLKRREIARVDNPRAPYPNVSFCDPGLLFMFQRDRIVRYDLRQRTTTPVVLPPVPDFERDDVDYHEASDDGRTILLYGGSDAVQGSFVVLYTEGKPPRVIPEDGGTFLAGNYFYFLNDHDRFRIRL